MESFIWMSYDLGVTGDYEGLYAWLDEHEAKECGSSVACFSFSHTGDVFASLKAEIEGAVTLNRRSRIYVMYKDKDDDTIKGRFVIGRRKSAPWEGFVRREDDNYDYAV